MTEDEKYKSLIDYISPIFIHQNIMDSIFYLNYSCYKEDKDLDIYISNDEELYIKLIDFDDNRDDEGILLIKDKYNLICYTDQYLKKIYPNKDRILVIYCRINISSDNIDHILLPNIDGKYNDKLDFKNYNELANICDKYNN